MEKLIFLPTFKPQFLAPGILQAVDEKGPGIPVSDEQGLRCEQELPEQMSVLQATEVSGHGHEERQ